MKVAFAITPPSHIACNPNLVEFSPTTTDEVVGGVRTSSSFFGQGLAETGLINDGSFSNVRTNLGEPNHFLVAVTLRQKWDGMVKTNAYEAPLYPRFSATHRAAPRAL
jgi:hypothetical protein